MQLAHWLEKQKVLRKDFAARINRSPSYVTAICDGTIWPSREAMSEIVAATGGEVMADDFLFVER